jgi:hypothetical protein
MRSGLSECIVFIARCVNAQESNSTTASGSSSTRMMSANRRTMLVPNRTPNMALFGHFDGATGRITPPLTIQDLNSPSKVWIRTES